MRVWASRSPALLGVVSFRGAVRCSWARGQEVKDIGLPRPGIPGGLRHPKYIALPALDLPTSPYTHPAFYSWKIMLSPELRQPPGSRAACERKRGRRQKQPLLHRP